MAQICRKCGRGVQIDAALFCPYCGMELTPTSARARPMRKTGFPVAAGILTIIAACISAFIGILGMIIFEIYLILRSYYAPPYGYLYMGIFDIFAFAFGLTGGILSLKRSYFVLSTIGIGLVWYSGVLTMIVFMIAGGHSINAMLLGLPGVILSILSLIFAVISKGEFA